MQISAKLLWCALLPILASVVAVTFANVTDDQLIQFMSSFTDVKYSVTEFSFKRINFPQNFNHLNRLDSKSWNQAIYESLQFFGENESPVVLVVGSSAITNSDVCNPVWVEITQRTGGILAVMDQRYFGESQPGVHTVEEYRKYFSIEQALYDIMEVVYYYYSEIKPRKKIIIVGEGYGGNLAAWFRMKYPHEVVGAMAINATLIPKLEFKEYFEIVNKKLSEHKGVMETIKSAYENIAEDIKNSQFDVLKDKLGLCGDLDGQNYKNIRYMFWSITWKLGIITELENTDPYKQKILEAFANEKQLDPVVRLKEALKIISRRVYSTCTHVDYEEAVKWLQNPDLTTVLKMDKTLLYGIGNRQQLWKVCIEHGHLKTSTKENLFGDVTLEFYFEICADVFGEWYDRTILEKSIQTTEMFYSGKDIDASNILFVNYENNFEKSLTFSEEDVNRNLKIINIPDVPDSSKKLTSELRDDLTQKYNDIYDFLKDIKGVSYLAPSNIEAKKIFVPMSSPDEETIDEELSEEEYLCEEGLSDEDSSDGEEEEDEEIMT